MSERVCVCVYVDQGYDWSFQSRGGENGDVEKMSTLYSIMFNIRGGAKQPYCCFGKNQ